MKPNKLIKEMEKRNITITRIDRTKRHYKCYLTNGRFVIASCSASDHRELNNLAGCARKELRNCE
jgi:hypothetical protein